MHRQSLGSPRLQAPPWKPSPPPTTLPSLTVCLLPPPRPPHKLIHLIPLLTLICFLILYLCSHTPSPSDLDHVPGFNRSPKHHVLDSVAEIDDIERYTEAKRDDVLAIRTLPKEAARLSP